MARMSTAARRRFQSQSAAIAAGRFRGGATRSAPVGLNPAMRFARGGGINARPHLGGVTVEESVAGMDGWLDSLKSAVKAVVPSHTIVGKLVDGRYADAAKATTQLVRDAKAGSPKPPSQPVAPDPYAKGFVASMAPQSTGQKMALAAAGGLALVFVLMRMRRAG